MQAAIAHDAPGPCVDAEPADDGAALAALITACRAALELRFGDPVTVQELLLVCLIATLLREVGEVGGRPRTPADPTALPLAPAFAWLEHVTREPWPATVLPAAAARTIAGILGAHPILTITSRRDAARLLRVLFAAVAGAEGALLPGSRFLRPQSLDRMMDALAFRTRSRRWHEIAAAAAKAFGLLGRLKVRNLDHMRGNHKRGDLVTGNYPKLIHVELATACNIRCRTSSITRPERDRERTFISMATLERLRPALPFITDCKLHGGGEPFLHPQIVEVLEVFREEGVRLNTVTNANLINERLARLIGETFSTLTVSVDGVDRETYEYVRVRGKWDKLVTGLELIHRHRGPDLKLIIGVVMLRCNIHQLADLVRFAATHGAQELQAAWLVPFHDLPWTQAQGLTDDPVHTNRCMAEARAAGRECGISVRIPNDLPVAAREETVRLSHRDTYHNLHGTTKVEGHCRLMYDRAMILVDGRVKPCGQSRTVPELGSIHARPFEACWNGAGYQRLRATFNSGTLPRTCMSCNFIRSNQTGTARLVY